MGAVFFLFGCDGTKDELGSLTLQQNEEQACSSSASMDCYYPHHSVGWLEDWLVGRLVGSSWNSNERTLAVECDT